MQILRCTQCGDRLPERALSCEACGWPVAAPATHPSAWVGSESPFPEYPAATTSPTPQARESTLTLPAGGFTGRVLLVDRIGHEPEDFSFVHLIAKGLMVVVAACSPFLILAAALVALGPGAVLLLGLAVWVASRIMSPGAMFAAWLALWGCRTPPAGEPVLYFRLRTRDYAEVMVRAKGRLNHGHFFSGDLLTCWGRWQHGVLLLRRAFNHRTHSWIEPRPRDIWLALIVALTLSAGAIAILAGAAAQFAEQTHHLP